LFIAESLPHILLSANSNRLAMGRLAFPIHCAIRGDQGARHLASAGLTKYCQS
jgi:hypothetical protein